MLFDVVEVADADADWCVVRVVGDIDLATAPTLRAALSTAAGRAAVARSGLAVDLTSCDFVDSIGLGVLLGGLRRQRERGLRFGVVAGDGRVRDLFERLGLDQIMTVVGDRQALGAVER